jgi:hypothetical protein
MGGPVQYEPLNTRGEEILNLLEERTGLTSRRWPGTQMREFVALGADKTDLDPDLTAIDQNWADYVKRLTAA